MKVKHPTALTRRSVLQVGTVALAGLPLSRVLAAEATTSRDEAAKNVIFVLLNGGPATIDMWDMKPDARDSIRGEFAPIDSAVDGIQVSEHLPKLATVMDRVTLIRSITHPIAAHGPGQEYLMRGNRPNPAVTHPSIGSLVSRLVPEPEGVPTYMTVGRVNGSGAGYLGSAHNPFIINGFARGRQTAGGADGISLPEGFTVQDLERRASVLDSFDRHFDRFEGSEVAQTLDRFQQRSVDILKSNKTREALDIMQERDQIEERYGLRPLGMNLAAARRLVEAGARFVTVSLPGWDTHSNNFGALQNQLLPQLDQALAGLIEDLDERGMLDETLVVCGGEFGRTPTVNSSAGRDHWSRSMTYLLAGGTIPRGSVYGATDANGMEPIDGACSPDDLAATIVDQLGIDPASQVDTRLGRPMTLFRDGTPLSF